MMKGILFNQDMTRAILAGRKTVTRRVVKPCHVIKFVVGDDGKLLVSFDGRDPYPTVDDCQYQPGNILYVRETWAKAFDDTYIYKADAGDDMFLMPDGTYETQDQIKWRPSIHMPREAARLFLRVTDVRVERLQDITSEDCEKEGVDLSNLQGLGAITHETYTQEFMNIWNSTVKPADRYRYGWEANPFCWVITFDRISKEEAMHDV